jgi:PAP2 superfamily
MSFQTQRAGLVRRHLIAIALAGTVGAGPALAKGESPWCGDRCDQVVLDWNQAAHQVIKAADGYANPLTASRSLAMAHLAMHDAVNAVSRRYGGYASDKASVAQATGSRHTDEGAAAVAASVAAHDVLLALYPTQKDLLRATRDQSLHEAGIGAAVDAAVASGQRAAAAVLAKRAHDGSQGAEDYREGSQPGDYRFVPGTNFILMPHWRRVQPFALRSAEQFRVAPAPALASVEYARAFDEVKASGSAAADAARTPDQSHYAAFWYEFSDSGWNRVARVVAREHRQDLWERARTFALLNVAMADSYIAGWDSKLHHNFWRPVTAIRAAGADGNPATQPDAGWSSFLPTPPIQDHPSTHSALGAAAATVLAHAFERDALSFSFSSPTAVAANPVRSFTSFSQAARENADSRVRAGLHFRFATTQGLLLGQKVGAHVVSTLLTRQH